MTIRDYVNSALNALNQIATNEHIEIDQRIGAAEKILDYAARLGENRDNKTEAIGFSIEEHMYSDGQEFGEYIREKRKESGYTLEQLGDAVGLSKPYLSNVENGRRGVPSTRILKKLSEELNVPYLELMVHAGYIPSVTS